MKRDTGSVGSCSVPTTPRGHRSPQLAMSAVKPATKGDASAKPAASLPASERLDQLLKDSVVLADSALRQARTDTILKMIADAEIKPNALDSSYQTPLMKACQWGNELMVFRSSRRR